MKCTHVMICSLSIMLLAGLAPALRATPARRKPSLHRRHRQRAALLHRDDGVRDGGEAAGGREIVYRPAGLFQAPLLLRLPAALTATCRRWRSHSPSHKLSAATRRACGRQHDVLITLMHVGHRERRLRTCGQLRLPDARAGLLVIGVEYGLSARTFTREQEVLRHKQSRLRGAAGRRNVG